MGVSTPDQSTLVLCCLGRMNPSKLSGDPLLTRLRTYRYSTAATLAMLTGQTTSSGSTKEDTCEFDQRE